MDGVGDIAADDAKERIELHDGLIHAAEQLGRMKGVAADDKAHWVVKGIGRCTESINSWIVADPKLIIGIWFEIFEKDGVDLQVLQMLMGPFDGAPFIIDCF